MAEDLTANEMLRADVEKGYNKILEIKLLKLATRKSGKSESELQKDQKEDNQLE